MTVKWTGEQQRVIDTRNQNILVSAAAGSGKTAVLVARILAMVTDEKRPVDIDRLLVVTFTNAAAAEMRERIRDAIEQRAEAELDNVHLQRQLVLVHNAKITTIHSFCLQVLRNHFQLAGIDPSFRIADQGEILLLEQECVKEVIGEAYECMAGVQKKSADVQEQMAGMQKKSADVQEQIAGVQKKSADVQEQMADDEECAVTDWQEFEQFLEMTATGKNDTVVEELVLQLYRFALGQPWPELWLEKCRKMYQEWDEEPAWLSYIVEDTRRLLLDVREQLEAAIAVAQEADGPYLYLPALEDDLNKIAILLQCTDYESYAEAFRAMGTYTALSRKKDDSISPIKKQQVQDMRQDVKDAIADIRKHYFYNNVEVLRSEFAASGLVVRVLTRLTEKFMERLSEKKAEKNLLDFGDLEHLALKVLVKRPELSGQEFRSKMQMDENKPQPDLSEKHLDRQNPAADSGEIPWYEPTAAAQEYAEMFEEIMIDEYQDSNLVQEMILGSVAGRGKGEPNRFMVGDVKQSIYRFRLARPELFMEKYKTYRNGRAQDCRIDLHKNFRSRAEVLESVNYIFRQIMTENPGGVVYDEDAALYPGVKFEPKPENMNTELLLLEAEGQDKIREEAKLVGRRIREMVGRESVWDKELEQYRPAKYSDIVILLRTISGWAETFGEVLSDMGIPNFTGSQTGYFSAVEVRVVLSYLQILDNPVQDIPFAAVLRSAIGGFTDDELARIRIYSQQRSFYDCCKEYAGEDTDVNAEQTGGNAEQAEENRLREDTSEKEAAVKSRLCEDMPEQELAVLMQRQQRDPALIRKLRSFFDTFEYLRGKCGHTPVHMLLWEILEITGYGTYAASLPAGNQRKANLDMLVEKAIAYEATSYRGLYHFVRYIENLKKYDVDYGEANIGSEAEDTVRLLSIHKSKGLEFPIVFVSGMGKQFNESDIRSRVVLHPDFGAACDYVDVKNRTREATLLKKVIQQKTSSENLGEELRVLYVAMTRAREKLILTGTVKDTASKIGKWNAQAGHKGEQLSYSCLSAASTYLDWVMPALLRHPEAKELLEQFDQQYHMMKGVSEELPHHIDRAGSAEDDEQENVFRKLPGFSIRLVKTEENKAAEQELQDQEAVNLQALLHFDPEICRDREVRTYLEKVFSSVYPHEADSSITGKLSVSELKKMSYVPEETEAEELYQEESVVPLIPGFCSSESQIVGAARGTVYHTFMENLDFSKKDGLELQLEELISCGKMSEEEGAVLRLADIRRFLQSDVGQKMSEAANAGKLYRERPFVIGVPANEIREAWNPKETVLVQGIIDAYFYLADGSIVLLDYKTDRVQNVQTLAEKYHAQLDYYAQALERLTGRKVRERVLYSFHLGREIVL